MRSTAQKLRRCLNEGVRTATGRLVEECVDDWYVCIVCDSDEEIETMVEATIDAVADEVASAVATARRRLQR